MITKTPGFPWILRALEIWRPHFPSWTQPPQGNIYARFMANKSDVIGHASASLPFLFTVILRARGLTAKLGNRGLNENCTSSPSLSKPKKLGLRLMLLSWLHMQRKRLFFEYSDYLQVKLLIPNGVQFLRHGPCAFLDFTNLHGNIRIRGPAFILGDQPLCANNWKKTQQFLNAL